MFRSAVSARTGRASGAALGLLAGPAFALAIAGPAAAIGIDGEATAAASSPSATSAGDTVLLATGGTSTDAVVAAYLAGIGGTQVVRAEAQASSAVEQLTALGAIRVTIVGGSDAVSTEQAEALTGAGLQVERIAGPDRYATAAALATSGDSTKVYTDAAGRRTVLLARGDVPADAMAAADLVSTAHIPLLLTATNELPAETVLALRTLAVQRVVVLGGSSAVSDDVLAQLSREVDGVAVERVYGDDRDATAAAIAELTASGLLGEPGVAPVVAEVPTDEPAAAPVSLPLVAAEWGQDLAGSDASFDRDEVITLELASGLTLRDGLSTLVFDVDGDLETSEDRAGYRVLSDASAAEVSRGMVIGTDGSARFADTAAFWPQEATGTVHLRLHHFAAGNGLEVDASNWVELRRAG